MNIITKFTVATEQGIDMLLQLTKALALEKYATVLEPEALEYYIEAAFSERTLISELNSLANQWLVVYAEGIPAGYARVTAKGKRPDQLQGRRALRIADFGILKKFPEPEIRDALLDKCIAACHGHESIWINEYTANPFMVSFEGKGFVPQQEAWRMDDLPLSSVCLIR